MNSLQALPLPSDWEMKYDFSTKRHFYINHKSKITTWEDPRKQSLENKSVVNEVYGRKDFIEDDAEMDKIIKMTEKEDAVEKDLQKFYTKYPGFDRNYIKELLIKSKGNASSVEIILRQERRKETSSIISYSTIDSGVSGSKKKLCIGEQTRFSLSERSKYDAPESSKDRIKSKLRSEFTNVDNRIVDRVLEVTDYSLEESRKILSNKNKSIEENIKEKEENKNENEKEENKSENEKEESKQMQMKKVTLPSFKNFVYRQKDNQSVNTKSDINPSKEKKSIATGPDPRNYSGAKLNRNKFK